MRPAAIIALLILLLALPLTTGCGDKPKSSSPPADSKDGEVVLQGKKDEKEAKPRKQKKKKEPEPEPEPEHKEDKDLSAIVVRSMAAAEIRNWMTNIAKAYATSVLVDGDGRRSPMSLKDLGANFSQNGALLEILKNKEWVIVWGANPRQLNSDSIIVYERVRPRTGLRIVGKFGGAAEDVDEETFKKHLAQGK